MTKIRRSVQHPQQSTTPQRPALQRVAKQHKPSTPLQVEATTVEHTPAPPEHQFVHAQPTRSEQPQVAPNPTIGHQRQVQNQDIRQGLLNAQLRPNNAPSQQTPWSTGASARSVQPQHRKMGLHRPHVEVDGQLYAKSTQLNNSGANGKIYVLTPSSDSNLPELIAKEPAYGEVTQDDFGPGIIQFNNHMASELRREAQIHEYASDHKNICEYRGIAGTDNKPILLMESLSGGTLNNISQKLEGLHQDGVIKQDQLEGTKKYLASELLEGIAHMHSRDIVHNDIKPDNIVLTGGQAPRPKFIDFGCSHTPHHRPTGQETIASPGYVPPIIHSQHGDQKRDMYMAGVSIHELFHGQEGFDAHTEWRDDQSRSPKFRSGSTSYDQFLNRLITSDPTQRMTAQQALRHPFLSTGISDGEAQAILRNAMAQ